MTRQITALVVSVAFLAVAPAAPVPKSGPNPVHFHPTSVGDTWERDIPDSRGTPFISTVTAVEWKNGVAAVTVETTRRSNPVVAGKLPSESFVYKVLVSETGIDCTQFRDEQFDPPVRWLGLPVKAGEVWSAGRWRRTAREPEEVTVRAGKFTAIPVVEIWDLKGTGSFCITEWYAPRVGVVRKTSTENGVETPLTELTKFSPK